MTCYFPESELLCPNDRVLSQEQESQLATIRYEDSDCPSILSDHGGISPVRAAVTEFLFTRVSPLVQHEAERQLNITFGEAGVPDNLITVHMRWGDKAMEMKLHHEYDYIDAVKRILKQRRKSIFQRNDEEVHIFLATGDPPCVSAFVEAAPSTWKVYVSMVMIGSSEGIPALGSLLVSMEANDFVLTTGSNWSRLINELRKNVLDPRCNKCTHLVDLEPDEW